MVRPFFLLRPVFMHICIGMGDIMMCNHSLMEQEKISLLAGTRKSSSSCSGDSSGWSLVPWKDELVPCEKGKEEAWRTSWEGGDRQREKRKRERERFTSFAFVLVWRNYNRLYGWYYHWLFHSSILFVLSFIVSFILSCPNEVMRGVGSRDSTV